MVIASRAGADRRPALIVEASLERRELIDALLRVGGRDSIAIECAGTVEEACNRILAARYAFILIDHDLPDGAGLDALELCEEHLHATPVIALLGVQDPGLAVAYFRAGAAECITEDALADGSLGHRVFDAVIRHRRRLFAHSLHPSRAAPDADELIADARSDPLTGLPNRRAFDDILASAHAEAIDQRVRFVALLIDIDRFKRFNDTHGRDEGDRALQRIAAAVSIAVRESDVVARPGAVDFAVVLPDCTASIALATADRIRENVETLRIPHPDNHPFRWLTISVGAAELDLMHDEPVDGLLARAEVQLRNAKRLGRNRVCLADAPQAHRRPA